MLRTSVDSLIAVSFPAPAFLLNLLQMTGIHREELRYFLKTLGKKTSMLFKAETSCLNDHSKIIADIIKRYQCYQHYFLFSCANGVYLKGELSVL